jgi:hypothetical protein
VEVAANWLGETLGIISATSPTEALEAKEVAAA